MIESFRLNRVQYIPKALEPGVLYVAAEFDIAAHLCVCGCGTKVTTPLGPTEWQVNDTGHGPTVVPSIGNWQLPCRSHYVITGGKTLWAGQWSEAQIKAGRNAEQRRRAAHYVARVHGRKWWVRLGKWLRGIFR
ncbi:DUF6527 family protein [Rhizobium ruizarguesonis]|uniref:DUF6527 family protein n=1 Tax=Rhizobium ruizarguesonis TaxID=2081791 RepID=UPI0010321237|nr:DUF6527 family protein [Rhizobium ruizarguesonis]TAU59051.1 hypothetical protein ELI45_31605 [Rhizobium ruizarguesonis]TAV03259.1 hypothetical protein ELI34_29225 [Rhizobium ruizarguesonis]TAV18993.1 hypothetical protein ELI35_37910 [Rhizobium ruizarguesonis]TAW61383.1 hypothetical protein ELI16_32200 [Rhizobium ruizarguesonis]TAW70129.1 hypothetical protein ELI11_34860 [Rhizobium ruizarguesonis]